MRDQHNMDKFEKVAHFASFTTVHFWVLTVYFEASTQKCFATFFCSVFWCILSVCLVVIRKTNG